MVYPLLVAGCPIQEVDADLDAVGTEVRIVDAAALSQCQSIDIVPHLRALDVLHVALVAGILPGQDQAGQTGLPFRATSYHVPVGVLDEHLLRPQTAGQVVELPCFDGRGAVARVRRTPVLLVVSPAAADLG